MHRMQTERTFHFHEGSAVVIVLDLKMKKTIRIVVGLDSKMGVLLGGTGACLAAL